MTSLDAKTDLAFGGFVFQNEYYNLSSSIFTINYKIPRSLGLKAGDKVRILGIKKRHGNIRLFRRFLTREDYVIVIVNTSKVLNMMDHFHKKIRSCPVECLDFLGSEVVT